MGGGRYISVVLSGLVELPGLYITYHTVNRCVCVYVCVCVCVCVCVYVCVVYVCVCVFCVTPALCISVIMHTD